MKSRVLEIALILVFVLILPFHMIANDKVGNLSNVKQAVELFCKAEYEGDEFKQRVRLIKFSQPREKKEKIRTGPASPWVVFWDWDPFYIVSSYKILNVEYNGNKGVATVSYNRVAVSKGRGRIYRSRKEQDVVRLDLVYDGKQWWIYDPPLPRISINVLIQLYESDLKSYDNKWYEKASTEQRKIYIQKKETLKMLKTIIR